MALLITTALAAQTPLTYPVTPKGNVVEDFFGTQVADPYRWLEDDNAAETKAWVPAQNKVSLTRIETSASHGAGKPTAKAIAKRTDVLAFLVKSLGMKIAR